VAAKGLLLTELITLAATEHPGKETTAGLHTGQLTMLVAVAAGRAL
jgi:hypothetical protein